MRAEVGDFLGLRRAAQVAPTVVALRTMASDVVDAELRRLDARVPTLDDRERDEIQRSVRRIVDKLLHAPTVRVQELSADPEGPRLRRRAARAVRARPAGRGRRAVSGGPPVVSTPGVTRPIRLGARTSPLARAQVDLVALRWPAKGWSPRSSGSPPAATWTGGTSPRSAGTGVFVTAVRDALRSGKIDVAVHSLKDLPTAPADDLEIIAVPEREDTRDVLVGRRLDELVDGARIGTGAPRREMQLLDWASARGRRLEVVPVRGNVDTRIELARRGEVDAVILAAAGLRRLGHLAHRKGRRSRHRCQKPPSRDP